MTSLQIWQVSETFKIIFDLDADGILNVTATHNQSGRKKAISIDSKSSGRMSSEEINNLVKKAEEMRVFDEYEESRVVCQNKLQTFCRNLELEFQCITVSRNMQLRVSGCLDWLSNNPNANEYEYEAQYKLMKWYTEEVAGLKNQEESS